MIEKNITNIDRGISKESVDSSWELLQLQQPTTPENVYAYKKIAESNIRYDNFYTLKQNTWQSIAFNQYGKIENVFTSSIKYFDENTVLSVYTNQLYTQSLYLEAFQIGYANANGSGSTFGAQEINIYGDSEYIKKQQTKSTYNSIKKLFTDGNLEIDTTTINDFVYITIKNQYLFDGIEPETLELHMSRLYTDDWPTIDIEGPAQPIVLIDRKIQNTNIGYILSGSINSGSHKNVDGNERKFGYIDYLSGTIILTGDRLIGDLGFRRGATTTGSNEAWRMPEQAFLSIYAAINGTIPGSGIFNTPIGSTFSLKSTQKVNYVIYQCDLEKQEFNYSNNITYRDKNTNSFKVKKFVSASSYQDTLFTGSNGQIFSSSNSSTYQNPESFVTTIGLYSDTYDLIAVAKLSKPIRKNYDKKIIINVRLDY